MKSKYLVALLLPSLFSFSGCAGIMAPETPQVFVDAHKTYDYTSFTRDKADYHDALFPKANENGTFPQADITKATSIRNEMLWSILNDVDYSYYYFETKFHETRATTKTVGDMAKLGMNAAATALGGSVVLSAATVALEGSELSIDKNYYEEKASESFFIKMDALRATRMAQIQQKMLMPATSYGFEEAYGDALAYFSAGTVAAALTGMAQDAGAQKQTADQATSVAINERVDATLSEVTKADSDKKQALTQAVIDALKAGSTGSDAMKAALTALSITPTATADGMSTQLMSQVVSARSPDAIEKLTQTFKKAKLIKDN